MNVPAVFLATRYSLKFFEQYGTGLEEGVPPSGVQPRSGVLRPDGSSVLEPVRSVVLESSRSAVLDPGNSGILEPGSSRIFESGS